MFRALVLQRRFSNAVVFLLMVMASTRVHAQLPLNIADRLVQPSMLKLETGARYRHGDRFQGALAGDSNGVSRASGNGQAHAYELSSALRYGMPGSVEVMARFNVAGHELLGGPEPTARERRQTLELGLSYVALRDRAMPALLLQASTDLLSSGDDTGRVTAGSTRVAATAYRSIDPVVLSLAVGYDYRRPRDVRDIEVIPGDVVWVDPQVNLAVNHRVTLVGGLGAFFKQAERVHGQDVGR